MKNQGANYNSNRTQNSEEVLGAKYAESQQNEFGYGEDDFQGFTSRKDMIMDSLQRYWENCKVMMMSSLNHLRSPVTIIVIIFLIATYILLGYAGTIDFPFYNSVVVQQVKTNLDIIVNAVLGYFFGPATCAIGVALCCVVRMIVKLDGFYAIYFICATAAGFLHGWLLYRHKSMWFGTRFRGFHTDLLAKVIVTRFVISTFINILLMAILYALIYKIPIPTYLMLYSKSGVELTSYYEFFSIFIVSMLFEMLVVFVALTVINFIVSKAFPSQFAEPEIIIDESGAFINPEEDFQ